MPEPDIDLSDPYFLSATNPTATVDQRHLEQLGLELLDTPAIAEARVRAAGKWRLLAGKNVPADADEYLEAAIREWAFHYLLLGLNADPNYPRVLGHGYGPPHDWFGARIPGNRGPGTGENPDNNYTFIPIDGHARFELHGRRMSPPIRECAFHIVGNLSASMNLDSLTGQDLEVRPDGTFVITIGPEPADGRRNHLQTLPAARMLTIRDSRIAWSDTPNAYRIQRLDPPSAEPLSIERATTLGARFIIDDIAESFFNHRAVGSVPPNAVTPPVGSASNYGGMETQKVSFGRLQLDDDEAFILNVGPGGSRYWVLTLYDYWVMSRDYWDSTTSFNNGQAAPNADGSYTFVCSAEDPAIHNWVDTVGLRDSTLALRWNQLGPPTEGSGANPWVNGERVKLSDLESRLPSETIRLTPPERRAQLDDRRAGFDLRYAVE